MSKHTVRVGLVVADLGWVTLVLWGPARWTQCAVPSRASHEGDGARGCLPWHSMKLVPKSQNPKFQGSAHWELIDTCCIQRALLRDSLHLGEAARAIAHGRCRPG